MFSAPLGSVTGPAPAVVFIGGAAPTSVATADDSRTYVIAGASPVIGAPPVTGGAQAGPAALLPTGTYALPAPAAAATGATAGVQRLTTLAPGALQSDADLVEQALGTLRTSTSGNQLVDRLLTVNARINVISDSEFTAMGQGSAHAFYDPTQDTMFLRRSDLQDPSRRSFAAIALAHEGTHLLDDVGRVTEPMARRVTERVVAAGGAGTAAGAEARAQGEFELMMVKETRAFLLAGQVARELGASVGDEDPTAVAIAGTNDHATYARVWERLLRSSYNEQHRSAPVQYA